MNDLKISSSNGITMIDVDGEQVHNVSSIIVEFGVGLVTAHIRGRHPETLEMVTINVALDDVEFSAVNRENKRTSA